MLEYLVMLGTQIYVLHSESVIHTVDDKPNDIMFLPTKNTVNVKWCLAFKHRILHVSVGNIIEKIVRTSVKYVIPVSSLI